MRKEIQEARGAERFPKASQKGIKNDPKIDPNWCQIDPKTAPKGSQIEFWRGVWRALGRFQAGKRCRMAPWAARGSLRGGS